MPKLLNDEQIEARIETLEQEERDLRRDEGDAAAEGGGADRVAADASRLQAIHAELDQLWDYLRQRRALRAAGQNPDDADMRDSSTVENYLG